MVLELTIILSQIYKSIKLAKNIEHVGMDVGYEGSVSGAGLGGNCCGIARGYI